MVRGGAGSGQAVPLSRGKGCPNVILPIVSKDNQMDMPQISIKRILYATDLSQHALHAFAYAASLADKYGAEIQLMHVLTEVPSLDSKVISYIGEERWEEIKQRHMEDARESLTGKLRHNPALQEALARFSENAAAAGGSVAAKDLRTDKVLVLRGNPVDQIVEQSEKLNCDLIVMGSHGHGNLADAMLGSTARRVLRRSRKPVLVIRLPERK
jgi:nucleotide-binding universal stress UspA family protein